jgi:hypothetical protein
MMPLLNEADVGSPTWMKLQDHMQKRLQQMRQRNDADQPETSTAMTRGSIRELKYLLALPLEQPYIESDSKSSAP